VSADPTFRLIGSEKIWERGAALTSRWHSFETELLAEAANLAGLTAINRELIGKAEAIESPRRVVLDMDRTEIPVYGKQEHSAYNGYFRIPANLVVRGITAHRKPPEVRICRLRNQSAVGTRPPSTSTPHCPACWARR
jgi:hypothetical protein